jgi:hypothetical protein
MTRVCPRRPVRVWEDNMDKCHLFDIDTELAIRNP